MVHAHASSFILTAGILVCLMGVGVRADPAFSWGISDKAIPFAGHNWFVKDSMTVPLQPGPCFWNPANVYSDASGLHLSVDRAPSGAWMSSEVMIDTSFGYGRYELDVRNALGSHDPNIIFGAFLWDETNGGQYNGEIDIIEASRFGDPYNPYNAQQVIAPWNLDGRINRFALPETAPYAILSVDWTPSDIVFRVTCPDTGYAMSWSPADKSIIPKPSGFERLHLNAWQNFGSGPWNGAPVNFTVASFSFSASTGTSVVVVPKNASSPLPAPSEGPLNISVPSPAPLPTYPNVTQFRPNATEAVFSPAPSPLPAISPPPVANNSTWATAPRPPATPVHTPAQPPMETPHPIILPSLTTLVGSAPPLSAAFTVLGIVSALLLLI